ncbi:MAG: hypothetical protein KBD78_03720 [Oligoflexales bacterium]|nr:hypothetical protein [Oligoflexales bacterium]
MWNIICRVLLIIFCACAPLSFQVSRNFEYEYSLILSYVLILFFPPIDAYILRRNSGSLAAKNLCWFFFGLILLALPSIAAFFFDACHCSQTGFLFWYILLVPTAWLLALFLTTYYQAKLQKTSSFKKIVLIHLVLNLFVFISLLALIYVFPQKRINGLFYGFLHGPIYDYLIEVDTEIVAARCIYFLYAALLLFIVTKKKELTIKSIALLFFVLILINIAFQFFSSLGVGQTLLQSRLKAKIEGEGFTLFYSGDEAKKSDYHKLAQEAEFHIHELRQSLNIKNHASIGIYVYPDARSKKLWFGGGGTDVADVFTPTIHINLETLPHSSLRHELVHALSAEFAFGGLGFHPNMSITEGLANVLAPRMRYVGVHESAHAILKKEPEKDLSRLFGFGFWLEAGAQSYSLAESFLSYLIMKFGPEALLAIYSGESLIDVTKISLEENLIEWKSYLNKNVFDGNLSAYANTLYHSKGVFGDVCPHSRVDLAVSEADWSLRLRQPIHWDAKFEFTNWQRAIDPNIKTDLVNDVRIRFRQSLQANIDFESCLAISSDLEKTIQWPPKNLDDVYAKLLLHDIYAHCGLREAKTRVLGALDEEAQKSFWGARLMYSVHFRKQLDNQNIENADLWLRYAGNNLAKAPLQSDRHLDKNAKLPFFLQYLLLIKGDLKFSSDSQIDSIFNTDIDTDVHLSVMVDWWFRVGLLLYEQNNFNAAANSFARAHEIAPAAAKPYLSELSRLAQAFRN